MRSKLNYAAAPMHDPQDGRVSSGCHTKQLERTTKRFCIHDIVLFTLILHSSNFTEKSQNETVLAEEYAKRKQVETQLEATSTKLVAISDKHNKMKETLQIAELKVAQTQAQAKMYVQSIDCI